MRVLKSSFPFLSQIETEVNNIICMYKLIQNVIC